MRGCGVATDVRQTPRSALLVHPSSFGSSGPRFKFGQPHSPSQPSPGRGPGGVSRASRSPAGPSSAGAESKRAIRGGARCEWVGAGSDRGRGSRRARRRRTFPSPRDTAHLPQRRSSGPARPSHPTFVALRGPSICKRRVRDPQVLWKIRQIRGSIPNSIPGGIHHRWTNPTTPPSAELRDLAAYGVRWVPSTGVTRIAGAFPWTRDSSRLRPGSDSP